jgi:DNA-binding transcriptional ArsR family regulator/uncharacterized protein YndB with AHSA1/START domain
MWGTDEMDEVFKALSDPSRRRLLDRLNDRNGQSLRELGEGLDMARQSVTKHLAVLEAANLVTTVRRGREKLHYLNAAPINDIADRWITRYDQARVHALADLKHALEEQHMPNDDFVYVTYIAATPEEVWEALTSPAFTSRYWGATLDSDWQAGSTYTWDQSGVRIEDPEMVVLESDPPRRLAFTFHTFTPEIVDAIGFTPELGERLAAEQRSKVAFDLEPDGDRVKLTVVHDGFPPSSEILPLVSGGWPKILSSMKTLLETGDVRPVVAS